MISDNERIVEIHDLILDQFDELEFIDATGTIFDSANFSGHTGTVSGRLTAEELWAFVDTFWIRSYYATQRSLESSERIRNLYDSIEEERRLAWVRARATVADYWPCPAPPRFTWISGVSERLHQPGCLVVRIETLDGSWADSVYGWSIRLDYECGSFRTIPEAEIVALPAEAIDRLGEAMADHIRYESAFAGLESIAERDYGAYTWSDEDSWSVDAGSGATLEDLGITGVERIDYAIEKIDETLEEVNRHDAD